MNILSQGVVIAAFLAFCRIGACFMLMPGLSSARVPVQVRLFVSIAATGPERRPWSLTFRRAGQRWRLTGATVVSP